MPTLLAAEAPTVQTSVATVTQMATSALGIITGNELLMALFCATLVGVGFRIIARAKSAAL